MEAGGLGYVQKYRMKIIDARDIGGACRSVICFEIGVYPLNLLNGLSIGAITEGITEKAFVDDQANSAQKIKSRPYPAPNAPRWGCCPL